MHTVGCDPAPAPPTPNAPVFTEIFPSIRIDRAGRAIEVDGVVPIDAFAVTGSGKDRLVYLEVLLCSVGTRDHETLVTTNAKPSHMQAAMLALGLVPGKVGSWKVATTGLHEVPPEGPRVDVLVRAASEASAANVPLASWALSRRDNSTLAETTGFVFSGSRFAPREDGPGEVFAADYEGTIVGLTTFGSEVVACEEMFNPSADAEAPHWIADKARVPPRGTSVVVTIAAQER